MSNPTLIEAATKGNLTVLNEILEWADEVTSASLTLALNAAAFNGHLDAVKAILQNGADVNARAANDRSPLDCAIANLHTEIIKFLLEHGADVNAPDESGTSPLHDAIDIEAEHAKRLYDDGDVDAHPTILISDLLLAAGADVNARTKKGDTPLRWAIDQAHKAAERLLREHGAKL